MTNNICVRLALLVLLCVSASRAETCGRRLLHPSPEGPATSAPLSPIPWFPNPIRELISDPKEGNIPGAWAERRRTVVALRGTFRANEKRFAQLIHILDAEGRAEILGRLEGRTLLEAGELFHEALVDLMLGVVREHAHGELSWLNEVFTPARKHAVFADACGAVIGLFERLHFLELFRAAYRSAASEGRGPKVTMLKALSDRERGIPVFVWQELARVHDIPEDEYLDAIQGEDALAVFVRSAFEGARAAGRDLVAWPESAKVSELAEVVMRSSRVPGLIRAAIAEQMKFQREFGLAPSPMFSDTLTRVVAIYLGAEEADAAD